jgi:hypothetical protein
VTYVPEGAIGHTKYDIQHVPPTAKGITQKNAVQVLPTTVLPRATGGPPPATGGPPPATGRPPPATGKPPPATGRPPPATGKPPPATGGPPSTAVIPQVPQRSSEVNLSSVAVVNNPNEIAITCASIQVHQGEGVAPSGAKRDSEVNITNLVVKPNQISFQGVSIQEREIEVTEEIDGQEYTKKTKERYIRFFNIELERNNLDDGYQPSFSEASIYRCCQAYSCSFNRNVLAKDRVSKYLEDPESMRKARALGVNFIKDEILTKLYTAGAIIKECILYGGLIALFVMFIVACVGLGRDLNNRKDQIIISFSIASLVLSFFGLCFKLVDVSIYLRYKGCRLLRGIVTKLCKTLCSVRQKALKESCCSCCCDEKFDSDSPACCSNPCKGKCCSFTLAVMDAMRIFMMETIFYPSLILSIFEFIVKFDENDYKADMISGFEWFRISLVFFLSLTFNYLQRAYVFASTLYSLYKARPPKNKRTGMCFQIAFVAYGCGQMVIQMLMIVMIGLRFQKDYSAGQSEAIDKSFLLWYMVVWAYLNPIIGFFMFFFIHHFWTFNFPVKLMYDILKQFQFRGQYFNKNEIDTFNRMFRYINMEELKKDIERYDKTDFMRKFFYPFISPLHIFLSMVYCLLIAGFFISFIFPPLTISSATTPTIPSTIPTPTTSPITPSPTPTPLLETHEAVPCLLALIITIGVNLYVFTVFLVWTIVIIAIIIIIFIMCIGCICSGSSDNRPQNVRYNNY